MSSLYHQMSALVSAGRRFAVATVVRTQGSTPQVVGAKLVVSDNENERPRGTLGGGCVEADAILACRDILAGGKSTLRAYSLAEDLAWNTGLVCGGTMWILAEPAADATAIGGADVLPEFVAAIDSGPPLAVATLLERNGGADLSFSGRMIVRQDGQGAGSIADAGRAGEVARHALKQLPHGTPRLVRLDDAHDLLVEPVTGKPRLVIAGGGHVAQAIARQAQLLDFDVTILEDRPEFADPARFGGARVLSGHIPDTLASIDYGWSSYIVVATRGHKLDGDCILAAVKTPARYIGLLGSRRKAVLIAEMLREEGISAERIQAIRTPVGLDLGGRTPAEIALSVMAEITKERYS